jgi:hypothetical protein
MMHQQFVHRQQLGAARSAVESDQPRDVLVDGARYRITRSRSPMDYDNTPDPTAGAPRRSGRSYTPEEVRMITDLNAREEDKEEEGTVENRETGLGTVVVA